MTQRPIRLAQPKHWSVLAASVTLSVMPAFGEARHPVPHSPAPQADAQLWLVDSEGGEGGEAGAVATATNENVAYVAEITIVEGHMLAAAELYARGETEAAVELSRHPEEEGTMDAVRKELAAHNAPDFSPLMAMFTDAMAHGASQAEVDEMLAALREGIAAAIAPEAADPATRFDAMVILVKAAAEEYSGAIENGAVADVMGYQESFAFIELARAAATDLQGQEKTAKAAAKALKALDGANEAFGDMPAKVLKVADPAILMSVAASVELIASQVR